MKDQELFQLIVRILDGRFSSQKSPPREIEEQTLEILGSYDDLDPEQVIFVLSSVVGVCRFERICEGAFKGYCDAYKRNKNGKLSMYLVTYILFFKLKELGLRRVRNLITQPALATRIVEYIRYLFDFDAVEKYSFPLWLQFYDIHFLRTSIVEPFISQKSVLETDLLRLLESSNAVLQDTLHQREGETDRSLEVPCRETVIKTRSVVQKVRDVAPDHVLPSAISKAQSGQVSQDYPPQKHAKSPLKKFRGNLLHLRRSPSVDAPRPRSAFIVQSSTNHSGVVGAILPPMRNKKSPTRAVDFSFLSRPLPSPLKHADATDLKLEFINTLAKTHAFYARVKAAVPPKVATTIAALRHEAHTRENQQKSVQGLASDKDKSPYDLTDDKTSRIQQMEENAQEEAARLLQRRLEAAQLLERVQRTKEKVIQKKRDQILSLKRKAALEAEERQRRNQVDVGRQQEFVRTLKAQLALNKTQSLQKCVSEKHGIMKEIKEEKRRIRAAFEEAEEQRRLEQYRMIHEVHLLRKRIKEREAELLKDQCMEQIVNPQKSPRIVETLEGRSVPDLEKGPVGMRRQDKELEEISRREIAAARKEKERLEQAIEAQREARRIEREAERERRIRREEAVRSITLASHALRVKEMHEKLESKRRDKLRHAKELRETERQRQNEKFLRNLSPDAAEGERWRQLEQGLRNRILAAQNARKSCAVSF